MTQNQAIDLIEIKNTKEGEIEGIITELKHTKGIEKMLNIGMFLRCTYTYAYIGKENGKKYCYK